MKSLSEMVKDGKRGVVESEEHISLTECSRQAVDFHVLVNGDADRLSEMVYEWVKERTLDELEFIVYSYMMGE